MRSNDDIRSGAFYGESVRVETSRRGAFWWGDFLDIYSAWVKAQPNLELACNAFLNISYTSSATCFS